MRLIKEEKLLFGLPIEIPNMGTIYQPTMRDFIDKNFDIQKFIRAFSIKAELIFEDATDLKNFDVFLYQLSMKIPEKELLMTDLIESLKLLYKTDEVKLIMLKPNDINAICISIEVIENNENKTYYINRDNYDDFANIILITLDINKNIVDEKIREELSEIEIKIEKRRREFEKKKAKREAELNKQNKNREEESITLYDLANYIIHADNSQFNYQNVLDLTIYQLKNTFNLYKQKENYKIFMDYKTSGQFKIDDNINHWFFKN